MKQGQEETYYDAIIEMMCHEFRIRRSSWELAFAQNGYLPDLVKRIESTLGVPTRFPSGSVPPLKVDIVIGIKPSSDSSFAKLLLIEVKRDTLQLVDYSQLFGYLFAGKYIDTGILFRVVRENDKGKQAIISSPEFDSIIKTNKLPLRFIIKDETIDDVLNFQIGIAYAIASESVCQKPTWLPTKNNMGLCSIDEVLSRLEK